LTQRGEVKRGTLKRTLGGSAQCHTLAEGGKKKKPKRRRRHEIAGKRNGLLEDICYFGATPKKGYKLRKRQDDLQPLGGFGFQGRGGGDHENRRIAPKKVFKCIMRFRPVRVRIGRSR